MWNTRKIVDDKKDADFFYGGEDILITPEDFEALKQGKFLNCGICGDEYAVVIHLAPELIDKKDT